MWRNDLYGSERQGKIVIVDPIIFQYRIWFGMVLSYGLIHDSFANWEWDCPCRAAEQALSWAEGSETPSRTDFVAQAPFNSTQNSVPTPWQ